MRYHHHCHHEGRSPYGHGHHGGWGRHGREGGRSRRFFDHGDLRLVILGLLAQAPRHGYELIKASEDMTGGAYSPSPGVIYPTLTLLEEMGCLAVTTAEGGRKLHEITAEGRAQLEANRAAVDALFAKMAQVRERSAEPYPPPVARAIANVFTALRLKLEQGPLDEAQVRAIAEALDTTAVTIERA
jgi:DNA-binding PadR family transcriptional regulator